MSGCKKERKGERGRENEGKNINLNLIMLGAKLRVGEVFSEKKLVNYNL